MTILSEIAVATTETTKVASVASGLGVLMFDNMIGAVALVSIVTLASRFLVLLLKNQNNKFRIVGILRAMFLATVSALLVAVVTLTLGVALELPMPIISAVATVFGAQPKLLIDILSILGRRVRKVSEE